MMKSIPSNTKAVKRNNTSITRTRIRRGFLLTLLALAVFMQGCFFDRLITLKSQACTFDDNFGIDLDQSVVIDFYDPVLLENDIRLIWGAAPTEIINSDKGLTMRYLFQRVPGDADPGKTPLLDQFNLDFDFIPVGEDIRLSKISSNELPAELLSAIPDISLSDLDEMAEFTCGVAINPFTRSMLLPLDKSWFTEIPARDELIALVGAPNSTLDDGKGLVYEYGLKGSDVEKHTATLVIWYDETGERALAVQADFSHYQMYANLLTAIVKVQFSI